MLTRTWALLGAILLVGLTGCSSGPGAMGRYDIEVSMDPELAGRTGGSPHVMVDLVGVNDVEYQRWTAESMSKYWSPASDARAESKGYRAEMSFGPGNTDTKKLSKKDPKWDAWKAKGAMHLFVLADLPGAQTDKPGAEDGRRLILPLDRKRWKGEPIKILVQRTRLSCTTPPAPPKK